MARLRLPICTLLLGLALLVLANQGASATFSEQQPVGANVLSTDTLNPPTGLAANVSGTSVNLSWTATSDTYAAGHRVLRGSSSGGPYAQIAQITPRTTTVHTDAPGSGTWFYVVRAYYQNWESANSNQATATVTSTYYLHNNPTPPVGNTNAQANLPLNTSAPTANTLFNYDQNRDAVAGLRILRGGSGAGETNLTRYQNWRTGTLGSALTINGTVNFTFWSAIENGAQNVTGHVRVFLRHFNGSTYTEICNGAITQANWQGGSTGAVQRTVSFNCSSYTIPAGQRLEVKIVVGNSAGANMLFAYDTTSFPSRLILP